MEKFLFPFGRMSAPYFFVHNALRVFKGVALTFIQGQQSVKTSGIFLAFEVITAEQSKLIHNENESDPCAEGKRKSPRDKLGGRNKE